MSNRLFLGAIAHKMTRMAATDPITTAEWKATNPQRYLETMSAANARRRANQRGLPAEKFSYAEIFDRDQWTCQLCGRPIDPKLRGRTAKSVSIDHILPISRGGGHIRDNVQAAHFGCNVRKSNRLEYQHLFRMPG